jgi:hypothetical protein
MQTPMIGQMPARREHRRDFPRPLFTRLLVNNGHELSAVAASAEVTSADGDRTVVVFPRTWYAFLQAKRRRTSEHDDGRSIANQTFSRRRSSYCSTKPA